MVQASDPAVSLASMISGARPLDFQLAQSLSGLLTAGITDKRTAGDLHEDLLSNLYQLRRAIALHERIEKPRRDAAAALQRLQLLRL